MDWLKKSYDFFRPIGIFVYTLRELILAGTNFGGTIFGGERASI